MNEVEPVTFGIVPGRYHQKRHFDSNRRVLEVLGYESVVADLPIADPDATFDDQSDIVACDMASESSLVLVAYSSGVNAAQRAADRLAVKKIINVCASFDPSTTTALRRPKDEKDEEVATMPRKYILPDYEDQIIPLGNGLTEVSPEFARQVYYNQCDKVVQDRAIELLVRQGRPSYEPPLIDWPEAQQEMIICGKDNAINPAYLRYIANNWLQVKPEGLDDADHSPFLSRGYQLARKLVELGVGAGEQ